MRDVLAGLAVAARRRLHQLSGLVAQVDGEAVELHLGRVLDRWVRLVQAERLAHARVELLRPSRASVGFGIDRQHRHDMAHRLQPFEHGTDNALRRRVGRHQLRMRRLDTLQLLEQGVVVGVGNFRRIERVVGAGVMQKLLAQLRRALLWRERSRRAHRQLS